MKTRIRILMWYVFSVVSYGVETWTYSKAIDHKINAFEMWCYRRMLRISLTSHTTNFDVGLLHKIGVKETTIYVKQPEKQTLVLWGTHRGGRANEKHIRTLCYSADNNRRKTGRQMRKKETKTNMGRRYKRMDWCPPRAHLSCVQFPLILSNCPTFCSIHHGRFYNRLVHFVFQLCWYVPVAHHPSSFPPL